MFLALVAVALVVSVPLFGGRLAKLAELRFRGVPLLWAALGVQILVISVWTSPHRVLAAALHIATYVLAAVFLWWNRRIVGVPLVALGAALNGVAIAANGGTLPASGAAIDGSGIWTGEDHFANSGMLEDPRLAFLGDVFSTPAWLPLRNVYSVGDVLIVLGAAVCLHLVCGSRVAAAGRRVAARLPSAVPARR